jgi:hypothetical protein
MNGWKKFTLLAVILIVIAGTAFFIRRLLEPRPSEMERLFDGTEVLFVEGKDLLAAWRTLSKTEYWQSRTYEGLQELPPVNTLLDSINGADGDWTERINIDTVMSAVGNESALGIYAGEVPPRFLLVSRVDPNFLLVDRLLSFAGAEAGITVTPYRGLRVKEAALDAGRSLLWALDGDLLLLSNDPDILYAALDRHIDKTMGRIASNRDFRRMKKDREPSRLISGYAVTGRLMSMTGASETFPNAARASLPRSVFFFASYDEGVLALHAEGTSDIDLPSLFPHGGRREPPALDDGVVAAVRVGRIPPPGGDVADPPSLEAGLAGIFPYLFPDGFTLLFPGDTGCSGGTGLIGVGETRPSMEAAIDRLRLPGMTERTVTGSGTDCRVLEKDGVAYLAWTGRGGRTVVSDRCESLIGMPPEILETGGGLGYTTADGEITLALMPRRIYRELERCDSPLPIPSVTLSLDQQRRLFAALYAAERVDGYASINGRTPVIDIAIHVEDAIP